MGSTRLIVCVGGRRPTHAQRTLPLPCRPTRVHARLGHGPRGAFGLGVGGLGRTPAHNRTSLCGARAVPLPLRGDLPQRFCLWVCGRHRLFASEQECGKLAS